MIKPTKLFPLPQDKLSRVIKPQSTKEEFLAFKKIAEEAGVKF
jgi:hypothetical protein